MEFSDQDLRVVLNRALRSVGIAIAGGDSHHLGRMGLALHVDVSGRGAIAATGILEWRQLMTAVLARLDPRALIFRVRRQVRRALWVRCCSGFLSAS